MKSKSQKVFTAVSLSCDNFGQSKHVDGPNQERQWNLSLSSTVFCHYQLSPQQEGQTLEAQSSKKKKDDTNT